MTSFWYYVYNGVGIPLLYIGFHFGALTNKKIRQGIRGRKNLMERLEEAVRHVPKEAPRFWIHSSSMGEFEQARPVIKKLKDIFPKGSVVASFFSPSAFEHVQKYKEADVLCYLPLDSRKNSKKFLDLIRPDVAIMVRHDLWPNHLHQLKRRGIPSVLINCSVHPESIYRYPLFVQLNRFLHESFRLILAVSQEAKDMCDKWRLGKGRVEFVGDTRYDQVVQRAKSAENVVAPLRKIKGERKGFVVGSTWPSDEDVIFDALSTLYRMDVPLWVVLVPHEPTKEHLHQIEQRLTAMGIRSHRLSEVEAGKSGETQVLLVDRVGILASLYALGDMSFVGGGFGPGIHNVLEPAALGKIVFFGPRYTNSYEARQLKNRGVGIVVNKGEELSDRILYFLKNPHRINALRQEALHMVRENAGATQRIVRHLEEIVRSL